MKNNALLEELKQEFAPYKELERPADLSDEQIIEMYRSIVDQRIFDKLIKPLWMGGEIYGYAHPYTAAEAISTGVCFNLRKTDYIGSTHRGHGHVIAKGGDMKRMMAELFGKYEGYNKGKGGSMHVFVKEVGMLGTTGIVGAGMPGAVGAALAAHVKGTDDVTVCFHGDGSSNGGVWHEAVNMAAAWKLPAIFVIENNQWAIATNYTRVVGEPDLYKRAAAYGIPGVLVDGFNVFDVYNAAKEAVARARAGEGPTLIEARFLRLIGHHSTDDNWYRDMEWTERYWELDPMKRLREFILENKIATEKELDELEADSQKRVDEAVDYARNQCTEPPLDTLFDDLYADGEVIPY